MISLLVKISMLLVFFDGLLVKKRPLLVKIAPLLVFYLIFPLKKVFPIIMNNYKRFVEK